MAMIRWEPSEGLASLRSEMDRLLEGFFGHTPFRMGDGGMLEPSVEVADTKDAVVVKAQIPGVKQEDIQVTVTDDALTLKGETKEEKTSEEKNFHRREFRYGSFTRTVPMPVPVQSENAVAQLKDGVLQVTIPKKEPVKVQSVAIQAG